MSGVERETSEVEMRTIDRCAVSESVEKHVKRVKTAKTNNKVMHKNE